MATRSHATEFDTDVAIVGGGPVGTALAIALAQRGVDCVVIEKYRDPQPVPKGQNLTQRTMEHFRRWGIEGRVRAARTLASDQTTGGMSIYRTLFSDFHYGWLQRDRVRSFYAAANERLPQYVTEAALRARLAELPSAVPWYDCTAEEVTPFDDGVIVRTTSRAGESGSVRARYVVGCDGSRSLVREGAGISLSRADHDQVMALVVFRSAEFDALMERFPDVSFVNILNPDLNGYWQFFGRVDARETWFFHAPVDPTSTLETLDVGALLARAAGAEFEFTTEYLGFWDLRFTLADRYRAGNVFIAGDAAHSHPPYGGFGINTGFEDAANLAWKLEATLRGWAGPSLLDSYETERRPVFASTRDDFIAQFIQDDRDFLATYDPAVDAEAFATKWRARAAAAAAEVTAFEPHYDGSPVIVGAEGRTSGARGFHEARARAGHHLAPGRTATGAEVFAELGPGFALLTVDPATAEPFVAAASRAGIPLQVVHLDEASAVELESPHILVRPDQFVAWAGDAAAVSADGVLGVAVGWGPVATGRDEPVFATAERGGGATSPPSR